MFSSVICWFIGGGIGVLIGWTAAIPRWAQRCAHTGSSQTVSEILTRLEQEAHVSQVSTIAAPQANSQALNTNTGQRILPED